MDIVFIEGISLHGKHGVHEYERQSEQEFIIDIRAIFDARAGAASDKLEDTIDYSPFVALTKEIVERQSFYLIEKLGSSIADRILEDTRIQQVEVTVRKPAALKNGRPGVTLVRKRA